ncbi:mechanosensitive ion channel family protein [Actinocorallia longicatena]
MPFSDQQMPGGTCAPTGYEDKASVACRTIWNVSHNLEVTRFFHSWLDDLVTTLLWVIMSLVIALVVKSYTHRLITKITQKMAEGTMSEKIRDRTRTIFDGSPALLSERRKQRMETMGSVLRSIASVVIFGTATFTVLGQMGLNLTPILASATVIGAAVGFGAQNIVKDLLAGLFMLLEDQYGVGDIVDTGPAKGTVEAVTLRVTRLRDVNGVVWYVRNGEITRIGNESQNWGRAVLDIPVATDQDLDAVKDLLQTTADDLAREPAWEEVITEEPSVWGVQALSSDSMIIRVTLKTLPGRQNDVARALRMRVKKAFDEAGIVLGTLA